MTPGEKIRLIGSGGAPVLLTVGRPFSAQEIEDKLASGEWRRPPEPEPTPRKRAPRKPKTEPEQ